MEAPHASPHRKLARDLSANRVVAATTAGKIYLLDAATGEVKWEYDAGGSFIASPAVVDGKIILGNSDGTLYCFGPRRQIRSLTTKDTKRSKLTKSDA